MIIQPGIKVKAWGSEYTLERGEFAFRAVGAAGSMTVTEQEIQGFVAGGDWVIIDNPRICPPARTEDRLNEWDESYGPCAAQDLLEDYFLMPKQWPESRAIVAELGLRGITIPHVGI